jgi:hypothetical protein
MEKSKRKKNDKERERRRGVGGEANPLRKIKGS